MALGLVPFFIANSFLNAALRRGEKKSDAEQAIKRQADLEIKRHKNKLDEQKKQQELSLKNKEEELNKNHEYRSKEQAQGYSFREQELEQSHEHRLQEQAEGHKYRLEEQTQASWNRCREIALSKYFDTQAQEKGHVYRQEEQTLAHNQRKNEIAWSNELQLYRDLRLRKMAQENALELEQIRTQYAVQTAVINRSWIKSEENNPFVEPSEQTIQMLKATYQSNMGKPLVVIAPFWDDTIPYKVNDEGGFLDYRMAIDVAWQKTQWFDNVIRCDGYLKRPLRHTDRDIGIISAELADIPTILIHGMVQGKQRVHPAMTIWNLLPNQGNSYFHLGLDSFDVQNSKSGDRLEFQNYVAHYLASIVGILSDAQQLFLTGQRPRLSRYALEDSEKLKLLASQFNLYYDLICYEDPRREHVYRLDQAIMLYECQFVQEAHQQIENALMSWYFQKNKKEVPTKDLESFKALSKLANREDSPFLTQLADVYQLIGSNEKAEQIQSLINSLKTIKYKPRTIFKP